MTSKEELLNYAIEMRKRGDTYRAMIAYLENNCDDEETVKEIVRTVDKMEKENQIKVQVEKKNKPSFMNITLGVLFLLLGIILMFFLWGKGWVSTVPFILITSTIPYFL